MVRVKTSIPRFSITKNQIKELCWFAYISDREIRKDLAYGYIRDEDDYTSNFTGALRRNINCYSQYGLNATSFLLSPNEERKMGCDATIIIHSNGISKVAVFEAKFPRIATKDYAWDYAQTATGLSHFSDQLQRQSKLPKEFAVFEMFYCEFDFKKQPTYMQDEVSSCIWHSDAASFDKTRTLNSYWNSTDLENMLSNVSKNLNIFQILFYLASCEVGQPIPMDDPQKIAHEFHLEGPILFINFEQENNFDKSPN